MPATLVQIPSALSGSATSSVEIGDGAQATGGTGVIAIGNNARAVDGGALIIGSGSSNGNGNVISIGTSSANAHGQILLGNTHTHFRIIMGGQGQEFGVKLIQEIVDTTSGTEQGTLALPANCLLLGVTARINTLVTGATGMTLGDAGSSTRYGTFSALTAGTTHHSGITPRYVSSAETVKVYGTGGSFTAGAVRVLAYIILLNAPDS